MPSFSFCHKEDEKLLSGEGLSCNGPQINVLPSVCERDADEP